MGTKFKTIAHTQSIGVSSSNVIWTVGAIALLVMFVVFVYFGLSTASYAQEVAEPSPPDKINLSVESPIQPE